MVYSGHRQLSKIAERIDTRITRVANEAVWNRALKVTLSPNLLSGNIPHRDKLNDDMGYAVHEHNQVFAQT